jgi:CRISPR-associated protein Cas6
MTSLDADAPAMLDIAFEVEGEALARDYRRGLAAALEAALPWLADEPGAGVHRLNLAAGAQTLLSRRTRLTLRVPRARAEAVEALAGGALALEAGTLHLGRSHRRELLPHGTLYAHLVAAESDDDDERAFLESVGRQLEALGVPCRTICGRHTAIESGAVQGYSLMLDGLGRASAVRVLEAGLGPHRRLGCGLFVAHRSASAVGAPP